ncbi:MAG: AAA family ATPase [Opitutaceae bacterium]
MIASIAFRNFKALRSTSLALAPCNLLIGPNGSGKTSLIEALQQLRTLSKLPVAGGKPPTKAGAPEIEFRFTPPHGKIVVRLSCVSELVCDFLEIEPPDAAGWPALRDELSGIRSYVLDHRAMGAPSVRSEGRELRADGANLAAVLARLRERDRKAFANLKAELLRIAPEFRTLEILEHAEGRVELGLELAEDGVVRADELSQGTLYLLAMLALAFDPAPPRLLCIEEIDRGFHPRMLREIRDLLYRLSYPKSLGLERQRVQTIATTHSPYLIDLFREHPEEIVISQKNGRAARFERLSDRPDLPELLREGSLGDMWYSGILGGVPEEK